MASHQYVSLDNLGSFLTRLKGLFLSADKVDGTTITVADDGTISAAAGSVEADTVRAADDGTLTEYDGTTKVNSVVLGDAVLSDASSAGSLVVNSATDGGNGTTDFESIELKQTTGDNSETDKTDTGAMEIVRTYYSVNADGTKDDSSVYVDRAVWSSETFVFSDTDAVEDENLNLVTRYEGDHHLQCGLGGDYSGQTYVPSKAVNTLVIPTKHSATSVLDPGHTIADDADGVLSVGYGNTVNGSKGANALGYGLIAKGDWQHVTGLYNEEVAGLEVVAIGVEDAGVRAAWSS